MATKIPQNAEGRFFIDTHCINCSLCPEIAPEIFVTNHDDGYEYIKKQPENTLELKLVTEAIRLCPANAIQDKG